MRKICVVMMMLLVMLQGCNEVPENTIHSLEDLKGKQVGVQIKTIGDDCASNMEGVDVQRYNRIIDAITSLREGETDAVIVDNETANSYVNEYEDIQILGDACKGDQYGIIVQKGNTELLFDINQALSTIEENGTLDIIMTKWLTENPKSNVYERTKSAPYKNGKLVVATNAEFPPFESLENGQIVGIDIDIIHAICDELDMDVEIQDIAFDSVISYVSKGMADVGISAMSITEKRKEEVDFSVSYHDSKQVVLIRK